MRLVVKKQDVLTPVIHLKKIREEGELKNADRTITVQCFDEKS